MCITATSLRCKRSPLLIIQMHLGRIINVQHSILSDPTSPSDPPDPPPRGIPGPGWSWGILSSLSQEPHSLYATPVWLISPLCIYALLCKRNTSAPSANSSPGHTHTHTYTRCRNEARFHGQRTFTHGWNSVIANISECFPYVFLHFQPKTIKCFCVLVRVCVCLREREWGGGGGSSCDRKWRNFSFFLSSWHSWAPRWQQTGQWPMFEGRLRQ